MMTVSRLDQLYRGILTSKFFSKGWGNPDNLKRLFEIRRQMRNRETAYALVSKNHNIQIDKEEVQSDCHLLEGHFKSPFAEHLPGVVPEECETAHFQMLLPKVWKTSTRPVCLHLAGTGDHYFWRRRTFMAKPLLKEHGIASIILENPFYGTRKPKDQVRSNLHNVSDIFVMGGCLMLESVALFNWCETQGLGPLGLTGISMGGHMACIAAGVWPKPLVLVPCLSWTTASCVFTQGVMSNSVPWRLLQNQYFSNGVYHDELRKMISNLSEDDSAFVAGQNFAKNYPSSLEQLPVQKKSSSSDKSSTPFKNRLGMLNFSTQYVPNDIVSGEQMTAATDNTLSRLSSELTTNNSKRDKRVTEEAIQFMRGIMDEFTHLANYAKPVDPNLIIVVAARDDAYVLREGVVDLTQLWKGAEVRYIDSGHVAAFIFNQNLFRKAIADGFDRLTQKYSVDQYDRLQKSV